LMDFNTFKLSDNAFVPKSLIELSLIIRSYNLFVYHRFNSILSIEFNSYKLIDKYVAPSSPIEFPLLIK
jgi:hypothetical protein